MAEVEPNKKIESLKTTNISVYVDEALPDLLVVSYEHGVQVFKGVLLDSTKSNLPCGVQSLHPAFKSPKKPDEDALYSANQRYAYAEPGARKKHLGARYKSSKMTVRLRPRQVLCSKCKGICNENSESVGRKRKNSENIHPISTGKRGLLAPVTRSVSVYSAKLGEASLVPKLTRLTPEEERNAMSCSSISKIFAGSSLKKGLSATSSNLNRENNQAGDCNKALSGEDGCAEAATDLLPVALPPAPDVLACNAPARPARRVLRKKRSPGSMEDLWDESAFEESQNRPAEAAPSTRTIKISYGPQGEGTVLKIPAQNGADGKAARRALKRAKKEARRKIFLKASPQCYLGSGSPRYTIGGSSPRYTIGSASPRHGLGNNSPRYIYPSIGHDFNLPRRRKHKVKHKKKHKEDKERKHKEEEVSSTQEDIKPEIKDTQKLSINLKRLNNTYTCEKTQDEQNTSSSDEHFEQVPDFPPPKEPIMLRISSNAMTSAIGADGCRMLVGDVVWGKVHGFPWWPAKVLTITSCDEQSPQAHVAWYGSSTSSLMPCEQLSPYLGNFKIRYNKKKRGPYKEAIKQATFDAKLNAEMSLRNSLGSSPQHNIITQVVPPPLASPREINVAS